MVEEYRFGYSFTVEGQRYRGKGSWDTVPGDTAVVEYNLSNPRENGLNPNSVYIGTTAIGFVMLIGGGVCGFIAWTRLRPKRDDDHDDQH